MERYSRLGFDILTYKTVRSAARPSYPLPNWVYVREEARRGKEAKGGGTFLPDTRPPRDVRLRTSAVCFGMPSMAPEVWRADIRRARRKLARGQVLVVSVVGTPAPGAGKDFLAADFVRCARWARDAGAHAVEANYSCPNVDSAEGSVYQDPAFARELTAALRAALPSTPLLIKAGHFETPSRLSSFHGAIAGAADGIVLVNGLSRRVAAPDGRPIFPGHEKVGIIGRHLHSPALENVRRSAAIGARDVHAPVTLAVGGVLGEADAADFFAAGAAAVLLGGGAALDPGVALRLRALHPEW